MDTNTAAPLCDACGERPATISDGMIGARICESPACFTTAWDRAHLRLLLNEPNKPALADFLLARIAEDEVAPAPSGGELWYHYRGTPYDTARVAVDCATKRQIVEAMGDDWVTRVLALPYIDHPEYRQEWKP